MKLKLKLERPIESLTGDKITHVEIRDYVTGGDLLAQVRAEDHDLARSFALAASMCGLDKAEFDSLDVRDINRIIDRVSPLLDKGEDGPKDASKQPTT